MKRKWIMKIGIALCFALVMMNTGIVYAEVQEGYRYDYIRSISAQLSITGGTAQAFGDITPEGSRHTSIIVRLQKETSPGMWTTVAYWTGSNASGSSEAGGTRTISSGYNYRVYVVGKVYDSSGSVIETGTAYSPVQYY